MHRSEIVHAIAALIAVKVGSVEQMIAQMAEEDAMREVAMEGLHEKIVASYFA